MSQVLPYVWYPAFFAAAIAAFGWTIAADMPVALATYAPIAAVAVAIVFLEWRYPERVDWRPRRADVEADATFMLVVQVLLPRLLAVLGVFTLATWMHVHAPSELWPHAWPLAAQIVAMVLAVDFVRYWVHRACHTYMPLWRLHEVHHSPDILYTLNVGRFHPLEKGLHFCCDTAPFLLLGVAPEVIGGYFLLYSVNGFFQHSNLRLRYGWLNYVVGSAETHRWHHARDPRKAMCNFGNTTIVWDLLFRTWYLPGPVDDIGIMDKTYPNNFLAQMLTPFRALPARHTRKSRMRAAADVAVPLYLRLTHIVYSLHLRAMARNPMRVQRRLLRRILRENRDTQFGRRHAFSAINGPEQYAARVPVADFESLRPFIDAEIERGEPALTQAAPVAYMRTSGTSGKPKDIPLTAGYLRALRRIQRISVGFQHRACAEAFNGGILAIVGTAEEGRLSNSKPYGAASGIVAAGTPTLIREKFVVPSTALAIAESRLKYLLVLRLAIARRDITYFGSANSTTPLALMKLYKENWRVLVEDVRRGGFFEIARLPSEVKKVVQNRLTADPARAAELARLGESNDGPRMRDLWPELRMVVTWTGGSAGITVGALRDELAPRTRIFELGYVASEFRGTITLGRLAGSGFPTLDTHYFEFAERDAWDRGERELVTIDRLCKGRDYYIVATTPSGLYRYFINDVVRVTGFLHRAPLLKFMQKGKGVTNITGEKLYEAQVLDAVSEAMREFGLDVRFMMMLADEEARRYQLYVEPHGASKPPATRLAQQVDLRLRQINVEYEAKRESARLGETVAAWLRPDTGEEYKRHCVAEGQREGQFKCVALAYRKDFRFALDRYAEPS
jgi:sterol desaturase/sphingolipid hydroxylase (fatty acid hydroxylase superfamily)